MSVFISSDKPLCFICILYNIDTVAENYTHRKFKSVVIGLTKSNFSISFLSFPIYCPISLSATTFISKFLTFYIQYSFLKKKKRKKKLLVSLIFRTFRTFAKCMLLLSGQGFKV